MQMIQNYLVTGLANDIYIIYIIYLLFVSQNWCIHVNIEYLEFLREESFYNKYKYSLV